MTCLGEPAVGGSGQSTERSPGNTQLVAVSGLCSARGGKAGCGTRGRRNLLGWEGVAQSKCRLRGTTRRLSRPPCLASQLCYAIADIPSPPWLGSLPKLLPCHNAKVPHSKPEAPPNPRPGTAVGSTGVGWYHIPGSSGLSVSGLSKRSLVEFSQGHTCNNSQQYCTRGPHEAVPTGQGVLTQNRRRSWFPAFGIAWANSKSYFTDCGDQTPTAGTYRVPPQGDGVFELDSCKGVVAQLPAAVGVSVG